VLDGAVVMATIMTVGLLLSDVVEIAVAIFTAAVHAIANDATTLCLNKYV